MSRVICTAAIDGATGWLARAEGMLARALEEKGPAAAVAFPETAYYLPVTYALTGQAVQNLEDLRQTLRRAKQWLPARPEPDCWLPYLGPALDAGLAALLACEIIEACAYLAGPHPVQGIWRGAASDVIMRERGVEFVDGTAPGFAAVTGAAPDSATAVKIARELQEKNIYVFMAGGANGTSFAEQLAAENVQLGWETRLVPFGPRVSSLIYALGFANRAAMAFGGVKPGQARQNLLFNKNRVFAFVLALGEVTADKYAVAAGAINYGFPVIADTDIPEILPTGVCTYEHVVANVDHARMVEKALEVRGCKITIHEVPVPVAYGPAFEGEIIRKNEVHAEFGGRRTLAFEFVTMAGLDEIEDHAIEIIGPDVDEVEQGAALPLAIWVEVAGRKMQPDFEPILERQIHHLINSAEGIWHMGQRDMVWTRISAAAFAKGFRLRHYGEILHAKLLSEYPAIVDKVRVTLVTDAAEVEKRVGTARRVYDERSRRMQSMTDESVDTFYSCLLCQSFAPNHVCVITPERSGLCGAYNWLDGKAAFEIDQTGPNQPISKGLCLDRTKGVWEGVNDYVRENSRRAIDRVCAYAVMDSPMTSCGCFEAICAYVPECNGVMIVHREHAGETPVGMKFSTLAGNVGGGVQTPGFIGLSKIYLTSRKFLLPEGGQKRLVWMPKGLKEQLADDLGRRFRELGEPDLLDKIADETVAVAPADVRAHMEKVAHPALLMADMEQTAQNQDPQGHASQHTPAPNAAARPEPARDQAGPPADRAAPLPAPRAADLDMQALKDELLQQIRRDVAREVVAEIIDTLRARFLDEQPAARPADQAKAAVAPPAAASFAVEGPDEPLSGLCEVQVVVDEHRRPVHTVVLGPEDDPARSLRVGGATAMPFHHFEGVFPHRPCVALEVFDAVSPKHSPLLARQYGELLRDPAAMARHCVDTLGADLIGVRLDSTHPERGGASPDSAVAAVGAVLDAVDVPLIITGHGHFESNNEMMKAVAKTFAGKNLLLNWVEQDNYRTIAGAALAYGHRVVAQSPIDVNIGKQLNILLKTLGLGLDRIVMDPTTGALGYGLEYTYSVMERIRLTGLGGDEALASPMLVAPGPECTRIKELKASGTEFPAWGDLERRAMLWELNTAVSLLYAGADILLMHNPEAAAALRTTILDLATPEGEN